MCVNVLFITGISDNGALYTTGLLSPEAFNCNIAPPMR
jgi:hypothetical protein